MSTRSLTMVYDGMSSIQKSEKRINDIKASTHMGNYIGKEIAVMYKHHDGNPTGLGIELKEMLSGIEVVNGIDINRKGIRQANGMGCLFAQMISHFKDGVGGVYLYPAGTRDCGEEYHYHIFPDTDGLFLVVIETWENKIIYKGSIKDYEPKN